MTHYFPKDCVLDERDRDVAAALGMVLTPLPVEQITTALLPDHPGVGTLSAATLNERLGRLAFECAEKILSWGLTYAAFRHSFPREAPPAPPPAEEERDDRFSSLRDRLSSSAQQ